MKHSIHGVPGTLEQVATGTDYSRKTGGISNKPGTWFKQVWKSAPRKFKGPHAASEEMIVCEIRFDDSCFNGQSSFAITGHTYIPGKNDWETGGCIHDSIEAHFPELKHLIRWHLFDNRGPMHYIANTVYHASNLDGKYAAGEPNRWEERVQFGTFPITFGVKPDFLKWLKLALEHRDLTPASNPHRKEFEIVAVPHVKKPGDHDFDDHYSFDDYTTEWYKAPFSTRAKALEWQTAILTCGVTVKKIVTGFSKGKERNLDAARSCAAWPEATDEQLCLPAAELTALLEARAPDLLSEFKADLVATGLGWEP